MEPTQANTKKKEMAAKMKMGLTMHGNKSAEGRGMKHTGHGEKYREAGHGMEFTGHGEKAREAGKGMEKTKGMRSNMANTKGNFSENYIYSQHGKK